MPAAAAVIHKRYCNRGETFDIPFQLSPKDSITGWTLKWECRTSSFQGTVDADLTKTIGSGIALTNAASGACTVTMTAADTDRTPTTLYCTLSRTDAGSEAVLAAVVWTIGDPTVAS